MATCPVCDAELTLADDAVEGELMECDDCGSELEIISLDPVEIAEAPGLKRTGANESRFRTHSFVRMRSCCWRRLKAPQCRACYARRPQADLRPKDRSEVDVILERSINHSERCMHCICTKRWVSPASTPTTCRGSAETSCSTSVAANEAGVAQPEVRVAFTETLPSTRWKNSVIRWS